MVTISNLLKELQSFAIVTDQAMEIAEKSKINTSNSILFGQYVMDWSNGVYDECPDLLVQDVLWLL